MQTTLRHRRQKLAEIIDFPAILWSGGGSPRNFPANCKFEIAEIAESRN